MALSTSFSNFISFPSPPTKSPQPPTQLSLLSPFPSHQNRNNKFIPLVLSRNETSFSSSSEPPEDMSSSFTSSNSMFLASPYNVQIVVENTQDEKKRKLRRGRFFENTQDEKKRKIRRDAAKRIRKMRKKEKRPIARGKSPMGLYNNYWEDDPIPKKEEDDDDDDNWDLPEEDVLNF